MLWLCIHLPHFALELRQPPAVNCAAITDKQGPHRRLIALDQAASQAGLQCGMDTMTALARAPDLKLFPRGKSQELASLKALAAWAEQYSSHVCFDTERWLLWIEAGASLGYFGGLNALLHNVAQGIYSLGYTASVATAPTLEAAALLARHGGLTAIVHQQSLASELAPLAIHTLALSAEVLAALQGIGWRSIGEVLAIPRDQLARRFGIEVTQYLQRLLGERADPRQAYRAPAIYRRSFDFAAPVYLIEALLFPLRRLLGELQGYLRGRDTALQQLQLTLRHHQHPDTVLQLRTTTPQRDAGQLFILLREQLEHTPLTAAVTALSVAADQFVAMGDTQIDLFDITARDNSWANLLDKLRARLGDQAVHRLGLNDDHRPEKAWCMVQQDAASKPANTFSEQSEQPQRPLWLLPPRRLEQLPTLLGKPERIEAGWWSGEDLQRDYYIAETKQGSRWWLYRDAGTRQWFLQGLWA